MNSDNILARQILPQQTRIVKFKMSVLFGKYEYLAVC